MALRKNAKGNRVPWSVSLVYKSIMFVCPSLHYSSPVSKLHCTVYMHEAQKLYQLGQDKATVPDNQTDYL